MCRANRRCGLIQALLSSIFTGRVLRSPAVEFREWTAPLVITYYTVDGAHVSIAATFLHTASVPTASATGTRSTGTLLPVPGVRSQPTTATLTGSSAVYQTN